MEYWKDIIGYENYQVSSLGRVKSKERYINFGRCIALRRERILKFNLNGKRKYYGVTLSKDSKPQMFSVHRLVALAFIKNPNNKPMVNHINGDKLHNNYKNLEWNTFRENEDHAIRTGLSVKGEKNGRAKLKSNDIIFIRNSNIAPKILTKKYNVSASVISDIRLRKTWRNIK